MTAAKATHIRYIVLGLTVMVFLITYLDRGLMASALPTIQKEFDLPIEKIGLVLACYNLAYALFQIPGGWLGDRIGPRLALSAVVLWWSAFTFLIGFAWSPAVLMVFLFLFGAGEAGSFPIANRALSRWMLPAERGFAQGITHAGSRVGGTIAPVAMTGLIALIGWRIALFPFALVGVVWVGVWYWYYRDSPAEHTSVGEAERARIAAALGAAPKRPRVPWKAILSAPQMWILAGMYFCYGYDLNMFLSWFPKYLTAARGYTLLETGYFASLTLAAGILGDICGGVFSDFIIRRTGRIKMARRSVAIAGFLLMAVFVPIAASAPTPYLTAFLFGVAVFGMELTVGNSWAVTLDIGGNYAGSVSAVMNTFGNIGGALVTAATGFIVKSYGWHAAFYVVSALALLAALLFLKIDASRKLAVEAPV